MKESYQSFNYHTHTKRCSHASIYEDTLYVYYARMNGINAIGFSDHVPFNPIKLPDIKSRMVYYEVEEYINSINVLKKNNPDMTILVGFEAEYYPEIEEFLGELKNKVDYMIMGEHFIDGVDSYNNKDYPLIYADMVSKGIESGIFDIIAHPDIFIRNRNTIQNEEDLKVFDDNTINAAKMIATKAKEFNIPLELNVKYSLELNNAINPFWNQVSIIGSKVLFGLDAHDPKSFNEFYSKRQTLLDKLNMKFNFVNKDYNPIVSRIQNQRLNLSYQIRQSKVNSVYSNYAYVLLSELFKRIPKFENTNEVSYYLNECLKEEIERITIEVNKKDEETFNKIETLSSKDISALERAYLLSRMKVELSTTNQVMGALTGLIGNIRKCVNTSFEMGATRSDEVVNIVVKLIELMYTKSQSKKRFISEYLDSITNELGGKTNASKLVKTNPLFSSSEEVLYSKWNGFVNKLSLILLVSFLIGFGIGVAYMVIKLM